MAVVVKRTTRLAAPADEVWAHATSPEGINAELWPVSMSYPPEVTELSEASIPLGQPWFTSTLRLGRVPFDRHRLTVVELTPGRWFVEESSSLINGRWHHERAVVPTDDGCEVTDRVTVEPRLPGGGALTRAIVERIFTRRHAVLAARFGRR